MDRTQIQYLIDQQAFPDQQPEEAELVETHISYLILGQNKVYKFKKPYKYSFLDFSTLAQRKFYCEEELRLNRRLAAAMYHQVLPVYQDQTGKPFIPSSADAFPQNAIIDYTLQMARMDSALEMDKLLEQNAVTEADIDRIARKVAAFHQQAPVCYEGNKPEVLKKKFRDIESVQDFLTTHLPEYAQALPGQLATADQFVDALGPYLQERHDAGMIRDCHGDLHSKNIFLYNDPVIFDCIEFNEQFRHIDILNEMAFFCMDLEVNGAWQLSRHAYQCYQAHLREGMPQDSRSEGLFRFFKAYRANVRGKVIALKLIDKQAVNQAAFDQSLNQVQAYLDLMNDYLAGLPANDLD